ncbi:MAG: recombination regulator RecX [Gammaproteobacteria bacterium]|nr:recombination regulator RecX [Gammaproteobacteria bacterium]
MAKESDSSDAEAVAMRLLARREHSRAELATKLSQRGFDETDIEPTLDRLEQLGALSESRFVEQLVHARLRQGYGPLRIRRDLAARGVAPERAAADLDLGDDAWTQRAGEARVRHFGADLPAEYTERARQARFLERRGYAAAHIARILGAD